MDKGFSISGYLLSRLQPDDPQEARLRMLCVTISKDMPEERRERQLRPFASDMEFMNMIAGWMNGLPEAISHEQPDFERWLELFMTAGEAESTRYVMRLQIWYTHYCCVEELLTLCRLLQRHHEEHLEAIYHRMLYYFREARIQCGMPSTSEPAEGIEVSFKLLDASYEHINRKIILQAEELAELCGANSTVTFRRTFLRLFNCPVAQWLRQKRAEQVLKLLRTTHLPLPEIAEQCGFANQSYLSDFCKRNLGDTPVNIRRNRS